MVDQLHIGIAVAVITAPVIAVVVVGDVDRELLARAWNPAADDEFLEVTGEFLAVTHEALQVVRTGVRCALAEPVAFDSAGGIPQLHLDTTTSNR